MANTPQSRKRARQAEVHRARNQSQLSAMRTHIKRFLKAVNAGDKEAATEAYRVASSKIDVAARKNLHHANKAGRLKSRLNKRLSAIS